MSTNQPMEDRWVQRKIVVDLEKQIRDAVMAPPKVRVIMIEGEAGMGKTTMARLLGKAFGSPSGYEPIETPEGILYIGLPDMYDPETNSNKGLEDRIIRSFMEVWQKDGTLDEWIPLEEASDRPMRRFSEYEKERDRYDLHYKSGVRGEALEKQRHAIEQAFAKDLARACRYYYPVLSIDTIERMVLATDPIQREYDLGRDTASLIGWFLFQISELPKGTIILFGRKADFLWELLQEEFAGSEKVELVRYDTPPLVGQDLEAFLEQRKAEMPDLVDLLKNVQNDLIRLTQGNPLLLDMTLHILSETSK